MDEQALGQLDYPRILAEVSRYCKSEEASAFLMEQRPLCDEAAIEARKREGRQWLTYIDSGRESALSSWEPVAESIERLGTPGASLSPRAFLHIGEFCRRAESCRSLLSSALRAGLSVDAIAERASCIPRLDSVERAIFAVIDAGGELREVGALARIRQDIRRIRSETESIMRRYISDLSLAGVLQSDRPVLRSDRQVLAVRSGQRNRIKGIVHELSQSGQTAYIEPDEVVRKNNDLVRAEFELEQEIRRILTDLSAALCTEAGALRSALDILISLDCSCAAVLWGKRYSAVFASPCREEGGELPPLLRQARHPLFGEAAVPIDMQFSPGARVLIITGPNTGGKTAALKTFALFAMLNQTGLPVPAAEGSRLPVFSALYADIGDDQSLDESLSTFSAHMKHISRALTEADAQSLVLIDELGGATDAGEGGALAMAILDELIEIGSFALITTHHGSLKHYGYTHAGCENASVLFNEETLAPSYRIVMGVPGESRALKIAIRSGLPPSVALRAETYLSSGEADVSKLIQGLNEKQRELDLLYEEAQEKLRDAKAREAAALRREHEFRERDLALREEGVRELRLFGEEARKKLENLVRELREGEITREKTRAVKDFIAELNQHSDAERRALGFYRGELKSLDPPPPSEKKRRQSAPRSPAGAQQTDLDRRKGAITAGMRVRLTEGRGSEGIAERKTKEGKWQVRFGSLRMSVDEAALLPIEGQRLPAVSIDIERIAEAGGFQEAPVFELRLIGMRREEALKRLEHQLDLARLQGLDAFSVIHGKGEGILQTAVHEYLRQSPLVADFSLAPADDGGAGKTYVRLS